MTAFQARLRWPLLALLLVVSGPPANADTVTGSGNLRQQRPVQRLQGNCPTQIQLTTSWRWYEGGGEHLVIPETTATAGRSRYVTGTAKTAEYQAPLLPDFASCVAEVRPSADFPYRLVWKAGRLTFRVELPADTPANPSRISQRAILDGRPYVRWQIAD
ncbi:hypothetical protein [Synechococcus elongatus]|uniref:Uncharacterized protein n=2 Tax=Synechococcus elongatus TaxID=32046 RepID=Q31LU3_SYNE7|nr:hypothetical protein [Synechococcus elongatus]ABB57976.1 conserved hypothetical protein [Synechococcus elongatus PCC 7942 = FACHB-805]AJD57544.1 hypothetical protein M744_06695 [Synechococcus elongatus UTEX 2973]MBD2586694.1 hypothetical protein [Synechococcus elongatus FACHB-242]MBD2687768.1 hypothetical protein [Synechococcus elongatus FACHB-1061]MBD2706522.1 hypothetical protein [Synechococcus elongatus PCC 7942 = FACHB-805]